ncbi:FAD-binding domain-containing protein, partial [Setomelanomma holmii]
SQTCWLPAACFVRPKNALHVAAILQVVSYVEAKFAIRSGGHNPNAGFGSIDKLGVLIDMQDINHLSMQAGNDSIAKIGSGVRWAEIYEYLDNRRFGAVGGRDGDVGVAGYLLGGGMSFFPNMYGLGADSVENYKCILANSTFVNANAMENSDLFRALKGGGSNFAIVTEFSVRAHPIHSIWYSLELFDNGQHKAVLNATVHAQLEMEHDPRMGMFVNVARAGLLVGRFYASHSPGPLGFAAFEGLVPVATYIPATNGTLYGLISALRAAKVYARREPHVVSHGLDVNLSVKIHENYLRLLNSSTATSANLSYTIQPMGTAGVQAGENQGGNTLGIERVPQTWHASLVEWTTPEDDSAAHNLVQSMGSEVESLARARGKFYAYRFMNDASYAQSPLSSYGAANLASMNAVSAVYDPTGVFQRLQNAGFLVSRTHVD